jgi:hypothetical protein
MYTVLSDPAKRSPIYNAAGSTANTDGYLDILVKTESGTVLQKLYDDANVQQNLTALNVTTQPYVWGRANAGRGPGIDYVWNTNALTPTGEKAPTGRDSGSAYSSL